MANRALADTPSVPKYLTSLAFLNMFDRSSYLKSFVNIIKNLSSVVYLTMNQMIGRELIIT